MAEISTIGEERLRIGQNRRMAFLNFCNFIPKEEIGPELEPKMSVQEVERALQFVARKISEYRHRRCIQPNPEQGMLPPIPCDNEEEIIINRNALLWTLDYISDETLSTELLLPNLRAQVVDSAQGVMEAARAVRAA